MNTWQHPLFHSEGHPCTLHSSRHSACTHYMLPKYLLSPRGCTKGTAVYHLCRATHPTTSSYFLEATAADRYAAKIQETSLDVLLRYPETRKSAARAPLSNPYIAQDLCHPYQLH